MKSAVLILALLSALGATAAPSSQQLRAEPRSVGPLRDFHPLEALSSLLHPTVSAEPDKTEASHQLISLSEFPVWRLHHYNGLELKPVPSSELLAQPAPSTEFVADSHKPAESYGEPEETGSLSVLEGLSGGLAALSGIREAISSLRASVASLPQLLLGAIGLGETTSHLTEDDTTAYSAPSGGLQALPQLHQLIQLPSSVLSNIPSLPSLPFQLPIASSSAKDKAPSVYVVVNKPTKDKEQTTSYGVPSVEVVSAFDVPEKPVTNYEVPFVPPTYDQPPFELPTSYENSKSKYPAKSYGAPQGLVAPLNLPTPLIPRPLQTSSLNDLHTLAVASGNALNQFNTVGEAVEAINTLNELNSIGNIADSRGDGGFQPSQGYSNKHFQEYAASKRSDVATSTHNGYVASSLPARASPPAFKSSLSDPVIVMPSSSSSSQ